MRLPFAFALVCALVLLVASRAQSAEERHTNQDTIEVDVVLKADGKWSYRKARVHPFADGRILVCEEFKDNVVASCIVLVDDGDAVLAPARMLEEKV